MGVIYIIKNVVSNKVYIGQTINFNRRKSEHKFSLKYNKCDNRYIQGDLNKYGIDSFKFEILEDNVNAENLLERETYWINYYGGIDSENVYNEKDINNINKQARDNLSNSVKGCKNGMYGKHHTTKTKQILSEKISRIKTGVPRSEEFKVKMSKIRRENPVLCNKGKRKYNEDFVKQLREEYSKLKSYKKVYELHPDICSQTINHLIRFGTSQYPNTYK